MTEASCSRGCCRLAYPIVCALRSPWSELPARVVEGSHRLLEGKRCRNLEEEVLQGLALEQECKARTALSSTD